MRPIHACCLLLCVRARTYAFFAHHCSGWWLLSLLGLGRQALVDRSACRDRRRFSTTFFVKNS